MSLERCPDFHFGNWVGWVVVPFVDMEDASRKQVWEKDGMFTLGMWGFRYL